MCVVSVCKWTNYTFALDPKLEENLYLSPRAADKEEQVTEGLKKGSGEETLCPIIMRVWRAVE